VFVLRFPIGNMLFSLWNPIFSPAAPEIICEIFEGESQLSERLNYPSEKNNKQNQEKSQLSECLN